MPVVKDVLDDFLQFKKDIVFRIDNLPRPDNKPALIQSVVKEDDGSREEMRAIRSTVNELKVAVTL